MLRMILVLFAMLAMMYGILAGLALVIVVVFNSVGWMVQWLAI